PPIPISAARSVTEPSRGSDRVVSPRQFRQKQWRRRPASVTLILPIVSYHRLRLARRGKGMSFDAGNPFQSIGAARPQAPSPLPKIIAVFVALLVLFIGGIIIAVKVKSIGGGLAEGLHRTRETAAKLPEKQLWAEFADDEEEATKMYTGRWVEVSGEC